jgi:coronin-7
MLDFAGKGDRAIQFVEVTEREPWFVEGLRYTGEQSKGSCLVPKRAMDVMQCEVGVWFFLQIRLFMLMPVRIRILP